MKKLQEHGAVQYHNTKYKQKQPQKSIQRNKYYAYILHQHNQNIKSFSYPSCLVYSIQ